MFRLLIQEPLNDKRPPTSDIGMVMSMIHNMGNFDDKWPPPIRTRDAYASRIMGMFRFLLLFYFTE